MKTLRQIREQYDQITHKQENEERKLSALVDSGLMESKKLSLVKRAMNENNRVLTPSEKNAVMHLLESLIDNVVSEELRPATTRMSDMPSILVLKRKAIRVYPGGQNVGLYYSQQIDRYVAVPFDKEKADKKGVLSMMEEHQLDEISNELAAKVYAKRQYAADNATDDTDKALYTYKAGKTLVNRMAKKGIPATLKMRKKYKEYKKQQDALKATQNPPQPAASPKGAKKPYVDQNVMKSNAAVDTLKYGKMYHIIGGIGYRMLNKRKAEKLKEETLEEGLKGKAFNTVVDGITSIFKSGKKAPTKLPKGKRKPPTKADRLKNLDKNRNRNKNNRKRDAADAADDLANAANQNDSPSSVADNGASSKPSIGIPTRISPTGTGSKHQITVHRDVFDADRNTRYNKTLNTAQPQRQMPGQMMREDVEVDLDGNRFQLNNTVAKKLQSVYESLNKTNKKKMIDMMNESEESYNKVISFVVRH